MRILMINWRDAKHPRAGGADFRLQNVYAPLVEKGHEVILYSCAFKNCSKNAVINGIRVYRIGNDWTFAFQCIFFHPHGILISVYIDLKCYFSFEFWILYLLLIIA